MTCMHLGEKVALVTGAGKGIGSEIAKELAEAGAQVVVTDIDSEAGEETCKAIGEAGGRALFIPMDIRDAVSVESANKIVSKTFEKLDILVCNAGITFRRAFLELTPEEFDRTVSINLTGTFNTIKGFLDLLIASSHGKIVLIASASAYTGTGGGAHYAATKSGQIGMMRTLAKELGPLGINVNCIAPRTIVTEILDHLYPLGPERDALLEQIPLRRIGTPNDIANATVYLVSEQAQYISGQTLLIDGGRT